MKALLVDIGLIVLIGVLVEAARRFAVWIFPDLLGMWGGIISLDGVLYTAIVLVPILFVLWLHDTFIHPLRCSV